MKRFLKNILFFSVVLFIAYVFVIITFGNYAPWFLKINLFYRIGSNGHMYTRMKEVKKTSGVDILFLGASTAYRGFDPRIFKQAGYKSFNLGSSNQSPLQTNILLERYLDQLNPKLIVYEVNPSIFTSDGIESSLDLIANDTIDCHCMEIALAVNNLKTYNTLTYGYYRQLFNKNRNFVEDAVKKKDLYIPGGFVEKHDSSRRPPEPVQLKPVKWVPLSYQHESFEKTIKLIKKKGIKLMLVQAPIAKALTVKFEDNEQIEAYFSGKTPYYFNFNILIQMNDSLDFQDGTHLNQRGVEIFNKVLIREVNLIGIK